jgi:phospholipid/cholesterol/gamma-HCH transport system substrate-binding protein
MQKNTPKVKSAEEVKVGALTLGGLIIFLFIISFLGIFTFAGKGYDLNVFFDEVNGLKIGNEVRFAGVPIGKVDDIKVEGSKVKTILKINKDSGVPLGSKFSIGMDGVLGTKFVSIEPPSLSDGNNYRDGDKINGVQPQGLDQFMASSTKVLAKLEDIADAFNNVLGDKEVQKSMRKGFVQLGEVTENLNTFTKVMANSATANQQEINDMVAQLHDMSAHMNSLMTAADNNGATGRNVAAMADNMATASKRIEEVATSLQGVVSDPKVTKDLKETIHNAQETSNKANKILGVVTDAKLQAAVMYNNKENKWRTDAGAVLPLKKGNSLYLGGADIGDDTKLDFYYNRDVNKRLLARAGVMQGEFGVGASYRLLPKLSLFTDFYDFNDVKLRLGAEWAFTDNFSLIGQTMNARDHASDTAYLGVKAYF